ncbi:MAG TPA: bifunctional diguanylate cyclase/phosphodiesterase [Dissulfurispiraceae bacterium]
MPAQKRKTQKGRRETGGGLEKEVEELRARLAETQDTLHAIRSGEADALVVSTPEGDRIFTLQGAETPYRIIVENISEGAVTLISDGIILYANAHFSKMLRTPLERIIGAPFRDYIAERDRDALAGLFERALRESAKQEICLLTGDGIFLPVVLSLRRMPIDEKAIGLSMVITDISERKRAEELLRSAHDELELRVQERTAQLRESEERYRVITESAQDAIITIDEKSRILLTNPAAERMFGYTGAELSGKPLTMLMPERLRQAHLKAVRRHLATRKRSLPWEAVKLPGLHKDGREIPLEISYGEFTRNEKLFFIGVVRDITERARAEESLKFSESRFRNLFKQAPVSMQILSHEGRTLEINHAWEALWGLSLDMIKGYNILLDAQLEAKGILPYIRKAFGGEATDIPPVLYDPSEIGLPGRARWVKAFIYPVKDDSGAIREVVLMHIDITDMVQAEEKIKYQAYHDLLTGLPNRAQFMLHLDRKMAEASRGKQRVAVLYVDLDRFKVINDSLGHTTGDKVLVEAAERMKRPIRKSDTLARIGSDEFVISMSDIDRAEDAAPLARKIVDAMRRPFLIDGNELYVTASVGISIYPEDSEIAEGLLKDAHIAVSHGKEMGRDNYQFFNRAIHKRTVERLLLESNLRHTLEHGELTLHYQPQVDIRTGGILCFEALIRWESPDMGLLLPARFIPIAEEIGFIPSIDEWVLRTASAQLKAWQEAECAPLCVTVILSTQQFQQPLLLDMVSGIVRETGIDPRHLNIEVTESTAMRDVDIAIPNLKGLHDMGIVLSIDDFGTGYSSLNYLKRFPVSKLKIDKSFILGLPGDPDDRAIVKAVIAMGHNLKLRIVAEGVENDAQLSFLRENGCDEMQGFLFSKPLPPDKLTGLMAARR